MFGKDNTVVFAAVAGSLLKDTTPDEFREVKCELSTDSPNYRVEIKVLCDKWMHHERAADNRSSFFIRAALERAVNPYPAYIKLVAASTFTLSSCVEVVKQHYLMACRLFQGDYFNLFRPEKRIEDFMTAYNEADAAKELPRGEFLGESTSLRGHLDDIKFDTETLKTRVTITSKGEGYDQIYRVTVAAPAEQKSETRRPSWPRIRRRDDNAKALQVRDDKSPFPGYIDDHIFWGMPTDGASALTFKIDDCVNSFSSDAAFRMYAIPVLPPRPTGEERREWFVRVLVAFVKRIDEHGFSLTG